MVSFVRSQRDPLPSRTHRRNATARLANAQRKEGVGGALGLALLVQALSISFIQILTGA